MATTIDKKVTRRCPDIQDPEGRPLEVTLNDKNGGTLALRYVGLRSDPVEIPIATIAEAAFSEGGDLNVQPGWEDKLGDLMTAFTDNLENLVEEIRDSQSAVGTESPDDFDEDGDEEDEDLDDL